LYTVLTAIYEGPFAEYIFMSQSFALSGSGFGEWNLGFILSPLSPGKKLNERPLVS